MTEQKKWTDADIEDQSGKIAIVTGSNSGIGFEAARVLANKNASVIMACRSVDKAMEAKNKIIKQNPKANVEVMSLDLSSLKSINTFAGFFREKFSKIDLLINNAGVMVPPYTKTEDGFELQFGTNHLGHFALTGLLIDLILATKNSRIVNVSSGAHNMGKIDFNDLNWEKRSYKKWFAYGMSKIANLYFTYELQRKLERRNLKAISVASHPGWTSTNLQQYAGFAGFFNQFFAQSVEIGTLPTLFAATAQDVKGGDYYGPDGFMEMRGYPKKVSSNKLSYDKEIAHELWKVSENLTGVKFQALE